MTDQTPSTIGPVAPDPTDEEAAAIVAALTVGMPTTEGEASPAPLPRWRFSGRWWTKPVPTRRDRP